MFRFSIYKRLIKEQKQIKKEAEQKLLMKKKELEIMTRMDMKTVNKLLLTEDVSIIFFLLSFLIYIIKIACYDLST